MKYLILCCTALLLVTACKKNKEYCWTCVNHTYNTRNGKPIVDVKDTSTACGITEENIDAFEKAQSLSDSSTTAPNEVYKRVRTTECVKQ
ncbi:MAG: hypothetical protein EOP56_13330 [Sphingobacteriales bacterium]|nr:MAG: hypothetical protein EOP56_13330 [Sphingobacteriales bacterium]